MLIFCVFQCLEVRCAWLLVADSSFFPPLLLNCEQQCSQGKEREWEVFVLRTSPQAAHESHPCVSPSKCWELQLCADVGSRASPSEWGLMGWAQLVIRGGSVLCSCSFRKCQSRFGLRRAIHVRKEGWGIANVKAAETYHYHTLTRNLRSFVMGPAEDWKIWVQHPLVPSVVLHVSFSSTGGTSGQLWAPLWNSVTLPCAVTFCNLNVKSWPEKSCCAKYWRSVLKGYHSCAECEGLNCGNCFLSSGKLSVPMQIQKLDVPLGRGVGRAARPRMCFC